MNRRDVAISLLVLGVVPCISDAQQAGKVWRVGMLETLSMHRWVTRHFEEQSLERMQERLKRYPHAMALRRETVEHPFANLKYRILDNGRFLLRGLRGASIEMALAVLAYNSKRTLNSLGPATLHHELINQPM